MRKKVILIVMLMLCVNAICFASDGDEDNYKKYYTVIYNRVLQVSPFLGQEWADWTARSLLYYCAQYNVDPLLAASVAQQESGLSMYDSTGNLKVSYAGAVGIMQLMPATAAGIGIGDITNPDQNLEGGIRYLAEQLNKNQDKGDWQATLAAASYNAGPGAVSAYNGIPPYRETQNYVVRLGEIYRSLLADLQAIG